jgi:pimeloyl-ACP methyl ester carboxylesterase
MTKKRAHITGSRSVFALSFGIVFALFGPIAANAQVTVKHVRVTVSPAAGATTGLVTAVYCDTGTPCPGGIQVWNLGPGVRLSGGQTLVLTQTGSVPVGGNFDTSDRVLSGGSLITPCQSAGSPCKVAIDLDTGSGLVKVFTSSAGNPINNNNSDTGSSAHQEQAQWTAPVFAASNYTLQLGYADNVHGCTAPAAGTTTCFPNPFDGTAGTLPATVFIGHGSTNPAGVSCGNNCYDGGALLITGIGLSAVCMAQPTALDTIQLVDPVPDLMNGQAVTGDTNKLATGGTVVEGVAADSLTNLVFRMGVAKARQDFKITLLNDKGKTSESAREDGGLEEIGSIRETFKSTLTVTSLFRANGPAVLLFIYHAPADFPRSSGEDAKNPERTVTLKIESADGSVCVATTIKIKIPPVMLVHGVWGEAAGWLEFCTLKPCKEATPTGTGPGLALLNIVVDGVQRSIFTVERAEYKATNFEGFEKNAPIVLEQIRNFIKNFKAEAKVAAVQVDYVAHSMGGDVARQIVITPGYKREIHKLITIDTPFLGSPFADALNRENGFCKAQFAKSGSRVGGAVSDLIENSAALQKLKKQVIPIYAHVIAGVATKDQADKVLFDAQFSNFLNLACDKAFHAAVKMYKAPSDLVVPKDSQLATGLGYYAQQFPAQSSPPNTVVDGIIHTVDTTLFRLGPDSLNHQLALQNGKEVIIGANTPNPQHVIDRLNTPYYNEKVYTAIVP